MDIPYYSFHWFELVKLSIRIIQDLFHTIIYISPEMETIQIYSNATPPSIMNNDNDAAPMHEYR